MENLNMHGIESLDATFVLANARRLSERLEIHYTPKHGIWLGLAEIELSTPCRRCLNYPIPGVERMQQEIADWGNLGLAQPGAEYQLEFQPSGRSLWPRNA